MLIIILEATHAVGSISRGRAWGRTLLGVRHDIQLHCPDHHTDYHDDADDDGVDQQLNCRYQLADEEILPTGDFCC